MDRLTELEVFANVVELGGFTDAAKKLGISKSAASKHVTALENRLGARLLNRTTRRISPTEIGLAYFDKALAVIEAANEADEMATSMQEAPRGELKIAAPLSFGLKYVSPAVNTFLWNIPMSPPVSIWMIIAWIFWPRGSIWRSVLVICRTVP